MAKALLMRAPNMAALTMFRTRAAVACLHKTTTTTTAFTINHHRPSNFQSSRRLLPHAVISPVLSRRSRSFCIRATSDFDNSAPASIDSPLIRSMEKKIKEHLNAESVVVADAYGDGRHVSIDVISSAFEGQTAVNRQRMVYKAIWEELQNTVHAVDQMTTKTPEEAASDK